MVLLKNDPVDTQPLLPLTADVPVAVVGEFARTPRYQGGGSSRVNPARLDVPLEEIRALADGEVAFAPGFVIDSETGDDALVAEAVSAARGADVCLLFLGLSDANESEGFDRTDWTLPAPQLDLLAAVVEANPRTVVVLSNGSVVDLSAVEAAPAIIEGWLLGQAGGGALADVLYGRVDPSGRLAETIPLRLEDTPAYLNFPGDELHVRYGEGVFVGYRWYDARRMEVRYPFGHGLSYTSFDYRDMRVTATPDGLHVEVTVHNTGARAGWAVAQIYAGLVDPPTPRPERELVGTATRYLEPDGQERISVEVPRAELGIWRRDTGSRRVDSGDYRIDVAASSRDVRASATITIEGDPLEREITPSSTLAEIAATPDIGPKVLTRLAQAIGTEEFPSSILELIGSFPVARAAGMFGMSRDDVADVLEQATDAG